MSSFDLPSDSPVYVISVVARITGLHPQTLRQYDRLGLVSPGRAGSRRLYSQDDIEQLIEIRRLAASGVNLAGIKRIVQLENQVTDLLARLHALGAGPSRAVVPWRPQG